MSFESDYSPTGSGRNRNTTIQYDYNTSTNDKHIFSVNLPFLSGDAPQFSW